MLIAKRAWDHLAAEIVRLNAELTAERLKREAADQALILERNNADWLRTQCNTAMLRADSLFTQMTSARVPTPMYDKPTAAGNNAEEQIAMTKGGALPSLEDPGDELAQALGIDHADDGSLVYR